MAVTLSRNLKLRLNSNLTADSKYNLERLDLLGSTFVTDSTNTLKIRSQTAISIEPNSADLGGSGVGGSVAMGALGQNLDTVSIYTDSFAVSAPLGLVDQATGGTKKLNLQYKSDVNGAVDTVADRVLTIDVDVADRNLILGGDLSILGAAIALTATAATSVTLPTTGTLSTLAGVESLTNKTIDSSNTVTGLTDASISSTAAIAYTKLSLTGSVVNADISSSAAIAGSKINPDFGNQIVRTTNKLEVAKGGFSTTIEAASGLAANTVLLLPPDNGTSGQVLQTDGSGQLAWATAVGSGTVTSVDLATPAEFTVSGNPVTTSGTITVSKANQAANQVWSGPTTGAAAQPAFRSLVLADLPASVLGQEVVIWAQLDGSSKVASHSLSSSNVAVSLIDLSDNTIIHVGSVVVTDSSTITLTASEAPSISGWAVLIQGR